MPSIWAAGRFAACLSRGILFSRAKVGVSGASGFGISKPDVAVVAGEEAAFATGSEREW